MLSAARSIYHSAKVQLEKSSVIRRISHVHGKDSLQFNRSQFVVVSLVKDVSCYIDEFISHYNSLGAAHIVFIDNGSTDNTVSLAKSYDNVSVFRTDLPFRGHEKAIRRYFLQHYLRGSWVLCVDADEHFDYPYSSARPMSDLLNYLDFHGFNALTACMLDVYAKEPFSQIPSGGFASVYPYFDCHAIRKRPYPIGQYDTRENIVPPEVGVFAGGVRRRLLDKEHDFLLTKHPLMFIDNRIIPFSHPHYCARAKLADVTGVLLHYKFVEGFDQRALSVLDIFPPNAVSAWARENQSYVNYIESGGGSFYDESHSIKYTSVEDLSIRGLIQIPTALTDYFAINSNVAA